MHMILNLVMIILKVLGSSFFHLFDFYMKFVIYKILDQAIGWTHDFQFMKKQWEEINKFTYGMFEVMLKIIQALYHGTNIS